jgi:nucleoside-diphosphate-sugar epimerase
MTSTIQITGGTGTLGRHVVPMLNGTGARLLVLSRTPREPLTGVEYVSGDLLGDEGVAPVVAGATTVLHSAGGPTTAARAVVAHLVSLSVVAADRVAETVR